MGKSLLSRFGVSLLFRHSRSMLMDAVSQRLRSWVIAPFEKALRDIPEWRDHLPFE